MASNKGIFLDVDSSIVENNLRITEPNDEDAELNRLLSNTMYPTKVVKPFPGFCVKTKEIGTDVKVFVNICHTDAIPPPKDISEEQLNEVIESEDASDFRVPMSIGDMRLEKDKHGSEAKTFDIAIHPDFLKKISKIQAFKNFFMAVVFQGLQNKFGLITVDEKIILSNRKAFGTLQMHRIQQREINQKMGLDHTPPDLLNTNAQTSGKPLIETLSSTIDTDTIKTPKYKLYKKPDRTNMVFGEIALPDVISASAELTLDVGEDRVVLESKRYLLDIFVPFSIKQDEVTSMFDKSSKLLVISMPVA